MNDIRQYVIDTVQEMRADFNLHPLSPETLATMSVNDLEDHLDYLINDGMEE